MAFQAPCAGGSWEQGQSIATGGVRPNPKEHSVPYPEAATMEEPHSTSSPHLQERTNGASQALPGKLGSVGVTCSGWLLCLLGQRPFKSQVRVKHRAQFQFWQQQPVPCWKLLERQGSILADRLRPETGSTGEKEVAKSKCAAWDPGIGCSLGSWFRWPSDSHQAHREGEEDRADCMPACHKGF